MAVFVFATLLYGSICICHIAIWQYLYLLHCYMAVFVFATLLYGSICICYIAIWQYLYLPHCYMAVFVFAKLLHCCMALFVFVILIHLVEYAWCSGKKKSRKLYDLEKNLQLNNT